MPTFKAGYNQLLMVAQLLSLSGIDT